MLPDKQERDRQLKRLARIIHALWEDWQDWKRYGEKFWCHTAVLDKIFIDDAYVTAGHSKASKLHNVKQRREHVVPRILLVERCQAILDNNGSVDDVARLLEKYLKIVIITKDEQEELDREYKNAMPDRNWHVGDPYARLKKLDKIEIEWD